MADIQDLRLKVYEELCNSYRAIDDFRGKLLGFLPLATGAGALLLATDQTKLGFLKPLFRPVGVFGLVITVGLFFYELYGIKKCTYLINAGKSLENDLGIRDGQFTTRPPGFLLLINEPLAAAVIYPAVLAAWTFLAWDVCLAHISVGQPPTDTVIFTHLDVFHCWASGVFLVGFLVALCYNLYLVWEDIKKAIRRLKT
jgi:hypothetical protein